MDETLFFLLRFSNAFGLLLLISAVIGLITNTIIFITKKKKRYIWGGLLFIFLAVVGGIAVFASGLIMVVSTGNTGHGGVY